MNSNTSAFSPPISHFSYRKLVFHVSHFDGKLKEANFEVNFQRIPQDPIRSKTPKEQVAVNTPSKDNQSECSVPWHLNNKVLVT